MWSNSQILADLVTFTGQTLNGKLDFLRSIFKAPQIKSSNHLDYYKFWDYITILRYFAKFFLMPNIHFFIIISISSK